MKVIKKDGRIEDFMQEKIKNSLSSTSDDIDFEINQKELDLIGKEVEDKIISMRGTDVKTSTYEIRSILLRILKDMGYSQLADAFYKCKE